MTGEIANLVLEQLRLMRAEIRDVRILGLQTVDYMRKMEQYLEAKIDRVRIELDAKMTLVRDDLELMLKAELFGRLTHFETTPDQRIDALEDRVAALEAR
jgi:hypothetical protein